MKKLIIILLTVMMLSAATGLVLADPQNGGDEPFSGPITEVVL